MGEKPFKSGFVAIMGRPNVGKSTLLNALTGDKVSIISPVPQTTRYQIRGILDRDDGQIVFVDTPGIHAFKDSLSAHLNTIAKKSLDGCDIILYVADVSRPPGKEEHKVLQILARQKTKVIMVLNKMDLGPGQVNGYIECWAAAVGEKDPLVAYIPVSALTKKNVVDLTSVILEHLPQGERFYEEGTATDFPLQYRIADVVREKLFLQLKKEIPHSVAVEVEDITEEEDIVRVGVNIYVNRTSQKRIVIGKNGANLKKVGYDARSEIEQIFQKQVFLSLWVKVLGDWQKKPRILKEMGYWWT